MSERISLIRISEKVNQAKRRLPLLGLAFLTSLPTACLPDLSWHYSEYLDCGFTDKGIPSDHLIRIQKQTRFLTPDRFVPLEDYGVQSVCVEKLQQAKQR